MRSYGRITNPDGSQKWVEVDTDANGYDDPVWITTLAQNLRLQPNESPFYANRGIPAQQDVIQQIFPDYYVAQTQNYFAQYFTSLQISKTNSSTPTYNIDIMTNNGSRIIATVPT